MVESSTITTKLITSFFNINDKITKRKIFLLFPLVLIGAFMEIFLLSLIPIFVDFFINDNGIGNSIDFLDPFIDMSFLQDKSFNFNYIIYFLICFSVFKFLYDCFLVIYQTKLVFIIKNGLQKRLLEKYLYNNLKFFKKENTSVLVRNLTSEVSFMLSRVLVPVLTLFVSSIIIFFFIVYLFVYDAKVFLILLTLVVLLFFIMKFLTYSILFRTSFSQQLNDGEWIKHIQQIFGAIKEIKLVQKTNEFLNIAMHTAIKANQAHTKNTYLPLLTKNALEFLGLLVLILVIFVSLIADIDKIETVKLISVFGFALFRMLPIINKMFMSLQALTAGSVNFLSYINIINDNSFIDETNNNSRSSQVNFENIELKNIYVSYEKKILDFSEFKIKKGDFIGIKGVTGTGKSTFLEILMGLSSPDKGSILIDGISIQDIKNNWYNSISYVPQDIYLLDDTIKNNIIFYRDELTSDNNKLTNAISMSEIGEFINNLEKGQQTIIGERGARISGGQKQRLGFARAMYDPKPLIILDEATSSLDNKTESKIINNLMQISKNHTIIMVAHRESSLMHCSKVYNLTNHQLIEE